MILNMRKKINMDDLKEVMNELHNVLARTDRVVCEHYIDNPNKTNLSVGDQLEISKAIAELNSIIPEAQFALTKDYMLRMSEKK